MEEKQLKDFLPDKNISYIKKFNNSNITSKINEEQVIKCIRTVVDPEIPVNIADLGLIYGVHIEDDAVKIDMTLTAPGCGMGPVLVEEVQHRVMQVPGVGSVAVDLVLDPPWSRDMMSEEAQLELGLF